jgi:iron complex transport system substrate-binding protein
VCLPATTTLNGAASGSDGRRFASRLRIQRLLAAGLLAFLAELPQTIRLAAETDDNAGHPIIDMAGRTVVVPSNVRRAACLEVLCYEKFFLLGGSSRVSAVYRTDPPWMSTIDANVSRIRKVENEPNLEELISNGVDVVFLRYEASQLRGLEGAGIPAIVSQPPLQTHFKDAAAFGDAQKRVVRLFARIIGGDAIRRAEEWCVYYDERVAYVGARVAGIPEAKRLKAYYLRGPRATNTQGPHSNTYWYAVIAGAGMIVRNLQLNGQGPMSMEEIVSEDPDYIFVGRQYSPDLVLNDRRWQGISAVRHHHVVPLPDGMFYWDGSTEGVLLMQFIAKTLYPDRFADLDIAAEVQRYYSRFYGFTFSDEQIGKFIQGLTPAGIRRGY